MRHTKFRYFFSVYAALMFYVCMFVVYPAHDDWWYAAPKPGMNLIAGLMPEVDFWRPFDRIIEYVLGYAPYLFPYANHFLVLTGHLALCATLYILLLHLTKNHTCSFIGAVFSCLSPGIVLTLTNPDFINQVWTMVFGVTAAFFFCKGRRIMWFVFAFLSVLTKENGIVWFIAPVMLNIVYMFVNGEKLLSAIKRNFVYILIGAAGMILYFCVRFYLMGGIVLGGETADKGRYTINLSLLHIIRNYTLIIGGAVTPLDSLALFLKPRNFPMLILTGTASIVFIVFILAGIAGVFRSNRRIFWGLVLFFVCAGYISSPYAVVGHNSEATAYEMVFMIGLMLGVMLSAYSSSGSSWSRAILAVTLVCMVLSSGHKILTKHEYTLGVHNFLNEHRADFTNTPRKACVYLVEDIEEAGYATYKYPLGHGLGDGSAFNSLWGWKAEITKRRVSSDVDIVLTPESLPEYDTVFSLTQSGTLKVLRN